MKLFLMYQIIFRVVPILVSEDNQKNFEHGSEKSNITLKTGEPTILTEVEPEGQPVLQLSKIQKVKIMLLTSNEKILNQ